MKKAVDFVWGLVYGVGSDVLPFLKFGNDSYVVLNIVDAVYNFFFPIAMCFIVIYFLIEINATVLREGTDFTIKSVFKVFFKLAISLLVVSEGKWIWSQFLGWNDAIMDGVKNALSVTVSAGNAPEIPQNVGGFFIMLVMMIIGLIALLLSFVATLLIIYQSFARKLEMYGMIAVSPLGVADLFKGTDSTAIRYFKRFLALAVWGVLMYVATQLGVALQESAISTIGANVTGSADFAEGMGSILMTLLAPILCPLAVAGSCSAMKQLSMTAFGVS